MRETLLCIAAWLWSNGVMAQTADSYFVTTNNIKPKAEVEAEKEENQEKETRELFSENFPHRKLCDWTKDMRFMVMPEKMDMITGVFNDALDGKRVSCSSLRHTVMVYDGYEDIASQNKCHIFFKREDNGQRYYYEPPSGLFSDYCESKIEVPSLAYLGDVDKARQLFLGKKFLTQNTRYRVDLAQRGHGYEEVARNVGEVVTVKKIGVGSRAFPVKFVLEDTLGRQFYQAVTISRTNCGMREEELGQDNVRFTFEGSFKYIDEEAGKPLQASASAKASRKALVGRKVHLLRRTLMGSEKTSSETEWVKEYSGFTIERVATSASSEMVKLFLRSIKDKKVYTKRVNAPLDFDVKPAPDCSNCFGNIFGEGDPLRDDPDFASKKKSRNASQHNDTQDAATEDTYEVEPLPYLE